MLTATPDGWAQVADGVLDAHIGSFRGDRRVWCAADPDRYTDDDGDDGAAGWACYGCPILAACREQALRQEAGAGASFGIRGGLSAAARRELIAARPSAAARRILPPTWNRQEVIAYLAQRGYHIKAHTWSAKATRGRAPRPVRSSSHGAHWDVREIREWADTCLPTTTTRT